MLTKIANELLVLVLEDRLLLTNFEAVNLQLLFQF